MNDSCAITLMLVSCDFYAGWYVVVVTRDYGDFSTLLATCRKATSAVMKTYGIKILYQECYLGKKPYAKQRIDDEAAICQDVLEGKSQGEEMTDGMGVEPNHDCPWCPHQLK